MSFCVAYARDLNSYLDVRVAAFNCVFSQGISTHYRSFMSSSSPQGTLLCWHVCQLIYIYVIRLMRGVWSGVIDVMISARAAVLARYDRFKHVFNRAICFLFPLLETTVAAACVFTRSHPGQMYLNHQHSYSLAATSIQYSSGNRLL